MESTEHNSESTEYTEYTEITDIDTTFLVGEESGVYDYGTNQRGTILPPNYLEQESYALRGAFYEVYKALGCGFLEEVYQESLELELKLRGIPFISQHILNLNYKGYALKHTYKPDLICYGKIIVELKALSMLTGEHQAQLQNYLKATGIRLGFLVNFGHYPKAEILRLVR